MAFRGTASQLKDKTTVDKLKYDLVLHKEQTELYELVTKLAIVCIGKQIPLIIENPYSTTHYLTKYWAIKPKIIDTDRAKKGDYYKKPTQYWFIGCEPKNNFCVEALCVNKSDKGIEHTHNNVKRSLIHPDYARRFIKEFII